MRKKQILKRAIGLISILSILFILLYAISIKRDEMLLTKSVEKLLTQEFSGLLLPISSAPFKGFDKEDIEEGRVYFWVEENKKNILEAKIHFFILQSREYDLFRYEEGDLKSFNRLYSNSYGYANRDELKDRIAELSQLCTKGFKEVAQEEMFEMFSAESYEKLVKQLPQKALYFEDYIFELYENMLVSFSINDKSPSYETLFFKRYDEVLKGLRKRIKQLKEDGYIASNKEALSNIIKSHKQREAYNTHYNEQKALKQNLLVKYPNIKEHFKDSMPYFMKYAPLEVIEGNHTVEGDLIVDGNRSLLITGDLNVTGSISSTKQAHWRMRTFFIVLGDINCENYVYDDGADTKLFMGDLNVQNLTYLPSPTRTWNINLKGKLRTNLLIRGNCESITDKEMHFKDDYCTKQKEFFVSELYDTSGYVKRKYLFETVRQGKSILAQNQTISQEEREKQRIILNFKNNLKYWHSLYYEFAGFELKNLPIGEHYGHYIESDEIVEDVRHGTGLYLMSHDDQSLTRVKEGEAFVENRVKTQTLAYRFYWIMFMFSNWDHRFDTPLDYWKSAKQIDDYYAKEKSSLKEDEHLALYWVMHFGLLEDKRFFELKAMFHGTQNELLLGAFGFFEALKTEKKFTIKVDYKENDTLFSQRVQKAQLEVEKSRLSKEDKIDFLLKSFEKNPAEVINLVAELRALKQDKSVLKTLQNKPYEEVYSVLYVVFDHEREKWYEKFLEEFTKNKETWKGTRLLLHSINTFYKELDAIYLSKTIDIVLTNIGSLNRKETNMLQEMIEQMKSLDLPKDKGDFFRVKLLGIEKENLDFQTFANLLGTLKPEDANSFFDYFMEQDLVDEGMINSITFSPYWLLYYVTDEQLYPIDKAEKKALVNKIIMKYKLSKEDFEVKSAEIREDGKRKGEIKLLWKYLKPFLTDNK